MYLALAITFAIGIVIGYGWGYHDAAKKWWAAWQDTWGKADAYIKRVEQILAKRQ